MLSAFFRNAGFENLATIANLIEWTGDPQIRSAMEDAIRPALHEVRSLGDRWEEWWKVRGLRSLLEIEDEKAGRLVQLATALGK